MASTNKPTARRRRGSGIRQSISIPAPLAAEVRRVTKERRLTISRTLITLAERGVQAEQEAKDNLKTALPQISERARAWKKGGSRKGPHTRDFREGRNCRRYASLICPAVFGNTFLSGRSEERRVGKECRSGWWRGH